MESESLETCNICMDPFDETVRPHVLPCGHDLCGSCLTNSIKQGTLTCPHCQRSHAATNASEFPINYRVESLISAFRNYRKDAIPRDSLESRRNAGRKWQTIFEEEKEDLRSLIQRCEEMKCNLLAYENFLYQQKTEHLEIIPKIYELAHQNEEIVKHIETEEKRIADFVREEEERQTDATDTLRKFDHITSTKDFVIGSDEVDRCHDSLEEWRTKCQTQVPTVKTIRCSEKLLRETTAALNEVTTEEDDDAKETMDPLTSSLSDMDKLMQIRGQPVRITVSKLQGRSEYIKNLMREGKVYAVQTKEGMTRSGRISLKDDKIHLHYLQDQQPPDRSFTVEHRDLIGTLKSDSLLTFMDLAWGGSVRGRIHILLSPDTPLALHFRILCCGDLGPTYAHSRFLEVRYKGDATHVCVCGGDYEKNDGSGGAPLISGLNTSDAIYNRKHESGIVWSRYSGNDGPQSSQFIITTGNGNSNIYSGIFGRIQSGLEILKSAAKHHDISQVTIQDCGVILPF